MTKQYTCLVCDETFKSEITFEIHKHIHIYGRILITLQDVAATLKSIDASLKYWVSDDSALSKVLRNTEVEKYERR